MKPKVLIADHESVFSRQIAEYLKLHGFETKVTNSGRDTKVQIQEWQPRYILIDLMLPGINAYEVMRWAASEKLSEPGRVDFVIMSAHNSVANIRQAFAEGAADYLIKPTTPENLLKRLLFIGHHRKSTDSTPKSLSESHDPLDYYLSLVQLVLKQALDSRDLVQNLFNLTRMATIKVQGVRCSVIECISAEVGVIVAANDNPKITGKKIELYKYPEITNAVHRGKTLVIENLQNDPNMHFVKDKLRDVNFNSLIVCPLFEKGRSFGVLSVRMPSELEVSEADVRFTEIVAHVASLLLSTQSNVQNPHSWRKVS